MKLRTIHSFSLLAMLGLAFVLPGPLYSAERCEEVVKNLNQTLHPKVDEKELFVILKILNETDNKTLPPKFVTKDQARKLGWNPGSNLWGHDRLKGKSIGGDAFGNRGSDAINVTYTPPGENTAPTGVGRNVVIQRFPLSSPAGRWRCTRAPARCTTGVEGTSPAAGTSTTTA